MGRHGKSVWGAWGDVRTWEGHGENMERACVGGVMWEHGKDMGRHGKSVCGVMWEHGKDMGRHGKSVWGVM